MDLDFGALPPRTVYNLLASAVTPRPIAWVTTVSSEGIVNAAPYSFFNVMGHEPPNVALGLLRHEQRGKKDTAANILETGEFVVNLVPEPLAESMNMTAGNYAPGEDEIAIAGLGSVASRNVRPPRILGCPVAFECVSHTNIITSPGQLVVIGRVLSMHVNDDALLDSAKGYIDAPALQLVSRMHGSGWYARSTDLFQMTRPDRP
ncbi:flavin reductase family protein [Cupriavidus taiwanensis]|uniref:flavin reductase family protein n=1 Tax=Cupriavidus taiwanensis TaxID=164546 RepID=UPI000E2FB695|nr:flavin reductase family protein [Cupriavidus taiwanensis]